MSQSGFGRLLVRGAGVAQKARGVAVRPWGDALLPGWRQVSLRRQLGVVLLLQWGLQGRRGVRLQVMGHRSARPGGLSSRMSC